MAESQVILPKKLVGKARSQSPYNATPAGQAIRQEAAPDLNKSVRDNRRMASAAAAMRQFYGQNGVVSTAVAQFLSMANSGINIKCYATQTQEFSREGTLAAEAILASLMADNDYSVGFSDRRSLPAVLETALLEVILTGGVGVELVLDKNRLPSALLVFPYDSITYISKGNGRKVPSQKDAQGNIIELNYPTIFVSEHLKEATRKYALPLLYSGLQRLVAYETFLEDAWRTIRQSGMSRLTVSLAYDKVVQAAPPEVRNDPAKLASYLEEVRTVHENVLSTLDPEDSLVHFDLATVASVKSTGEMSEVSVLVDQLSGLTASALKSSPSSLGLRLGGTQNVGSTESMQSLKTAELFQGPVEEALSRALTLACRLYGVDCYVEMSFNPIDLRPASELEAHLAIRQNRALELLSYGRITDDECQALLSLGSLPEGAETLSGTKFLATKTPDSLPVAATNSRNRQISPEGPTSGGGSSNDPAP